MKNNIIGRKSEQDTLARIYECLILWILAKI